MNFEEKVKSMSAAEIVTAMVNGLKKQHVTVDMDTFGEAGMGVCYGCAATNAICEVSGRTFTPESIQVVSRRAKYVNSSRDFLDSFENAINSLRAGSVGGYNAYAYLGGFAQIHTDRELPYLDTNTYLELLHEYEELAKELA